MFATILTDRHTDRPEYLALDLIDIRDKLNDLLEIYNFLSQLAVNLREKELYKPVLIPYYHGKIKEDCGVSCYLFFESGGYVTFHIFEKRKIAYLDIVSNKKINRNIIEFVKDFSQAKNCNVYSKNNNEYISNNNSVFGPHYFAFGEAYRNLSLDDLLEFQSEIIKDIKMTPITNPVIVKTNKQQTLFIAIAESHIALTQTRKNLIIDVFSCKNFDLKKLEKIIAKYLSIKSEKLYQRFSK